MLFCDDGSRYYTDWWSQTSSYVIHNSASGPELIHKTVAHNSPMGTWTRMGLFLDAAGNLHVQENGADVDVENTPPACPRGITHIQLAAGTNPGAYTINVRFDTVQLGPNGCY